MEKLSAITEQLLGDIPALEAEIMTNAYRSSVQAGQTKLIVHDDVDLLNYISNNFLKLTRKVNPPAEYVWKIAFCPMYFQSGGSNKLTISLLAVLKRMGSDEVIDYWTSKKNNDDFYKNQFKPLEDAAIAAGFKSFIFDEGQLWP